MYRPFSAGFSGDNSGNWVPINNVATTNFLGEEIPIQIAEDLIVPAVTIDQSLTKLFQCMTLAYRLVIKNNFPINCITPISISHLQFQVDIPTMEELQRAAFAVEG